MKRKHAFSVVFCSALCLHLSLSSAACLSATKPPSFAKSCSISILLLPLLGLPFILPSIISCRSPSCLRTWPIHRSTHSDVIKMKRILSAAVEKEQLWICVRGANVANNDMCKHRSFSVMDLNYSWKKNYYQLLWYSGLWILGRLPKVDLIILEGEKCPSVRTSVRPSVHKKFLRFEWNLVYR